MGGSDGLLGSSCADRGADAGVLVFLVSGSRSLGAGGGDLRFSPVVASGFVSSRGFSVASSLGDEVVSC